MVEGGRLGGVGNVKKRVLFVNVEDRVQGGSRCGRFGCGEGGEVVLNRTNPVQVVRPAGKC